MENPKESIFQIGNSIQSHVNKELQYNYPIKAIARAHCTIITDKGDICINNYWLTNENPYKAGRDYKDITGAVAGHASGKYLALVEDGQPIHKNSKLGEILVKNYSGQHVYRVPHPHRKRHYYENVVEIHNRSEYRPNYGNPSEVEIMLSGESAPHRFQRLSVLLNALREDEIRLKKLEEERKRIEKDRLRIARELEEKKAREEQERLEAEKQQKEEEERKNREEIERINMLHAEDLMKVKAVRSFMRKNVMLRSQHLLDSYQEDAKRSHIYDGTPIIIEGGPGTGKTTTMIQRLMFLLSYQALKEYEAPLSDQQIEILTNPSEKDNHWLFFSPTEMLLQYLRENMREEGLRANPRNTRTIGKFRNKVMRDYKLFNPAKDGPFKPYDKFSEKEEILILNFPKVIRDFETFIIDYCNDLLQQRCETDTSVHIWHKDAMRIKSRCKSIGKVKDISGLMNLFNSLNDNEKGKVKEWSAILKDSLERSSMKLQRLILQDETAIDNIKVLFEKWRRERQGSEDPDDEDAIVDDEDEDETSFSRQEFETQLFQELKRLLRQLGLKKHVNKIKISKHNQAILEIVKDYVDEDSLEIEHIGSLALFVRNYASLCRGIESNIIGIIHRLYKSFRKGQLEGSLYRSDLLKKVINKDGNKHLHPDEQNLILGFINEMLHLIHQKSRIRFEGLKHKYVQAFKENVRNVIGIDEATDYSLSDYYFMVSFRHYEFSSITLCGDLMQGLNSNGISDWNTIKNFNLPNLEVKSLDFSYRQLPTLLDMARELYKDNLGEYPSYKSKMERSDSEPRPLMLISDDEWEKADWIADRIRDIWRIYDEELPSVAIFVGDEVNISEFVERLNDTLNGIDVVDCSGDKQLQNNEMVRVFRLSEVKGMEFEAAFFYDIDKALASHDEQLMRRYLYVGISRATSHLAATMSTESNQDIIKYFDTDSNSWEM